MIQKIARLLQPSGEPHWSLQALPLPVKELRSKGRQGGNLLRPLLTPDDEAWPPIADAAALSGLILLRQELPPPNSAPALPWVRVKSYIPCDQKRC
jgi:hypothetical protein